MEAPWSKTFWLWFNYKLEKQFPEDAKFLNLTHLPYGWTSLGGYGWNYRWYATLVNRVKLPDKSQLVQVGPAQQLPASPNYIQGEGVDSVRRVHASLSALEENITKVPAYQELESNETKCFNLCQSSNNAFGQNNTELVCKEVCQMSRRLVTANIQGEMKKWRDSALTCMQRHSVASGDGNHGAFDKCLENFADEMVSHSTNAEILNTWISQYKGAYALSDKVDISKKASNAPA